MIWFIFDKIIVKMADLDLSKHSLNLSQSKQKYSFPKTKRFAEKHTSLYNYNHSAVIPSIKYQPLSAREVPP